LIEQRKLVKLGKSTLVISLPANWVRKKGLKAGDTLTLYIDDNEIVITPGSNSTRSKISITIRIKDLKGDVLYRMIVSAYIAGAEDITIEFDRSNYVKEILRQLKFATSHLIGLEIVDQSMNKITLQTFTDVQAQSLESLINRILKLLSLMLTHLKEENVDISFLKDLENEIDKLYRLAMRRMSLSYELSKYHLTLLPSFLMMLEILSDSVIPLANVIKNNYKLVADVIEISKEVLEFLASYKLGDGDVGEINERIEALEHLEKDLVERDIPNSLKHRCLNFIHLLKNAMLVMFNIEVAKLIKSERVITI